MWRFSQMSSADFVGNDCPASISIDPQNPIIAVKIAMQLCAFDDCIA
jgi:hypothetical protein